jgi:hypothetical protein
MVESILFYVAEGKDWEWISAAYDGRISQEAIAEAVRLASMALLKKTQKQRRAA